MQAGIRKCLDRAFLVPDDQKRKSGNVISNVIADFRNFLLATGELPHPAPQALDFQVMPGLRGITLDRYGHVRDMFGRFLAQYRRNRTRVLIEQLLIGQTR